MDTQVLHILLPILLTSATIPPTISNLANISCHTLLLIPIDNSLQ